ncbi:MAG: McrC family protein, partial [Fibromonadales bacterium]|nr:McrC family protein [Fibromonadales bacterium]
MIIRTTDNNCGKLIPELGKGKIEHLDFIANKKLCDINLEDNPNLLIFPKDWQLGVDDDDELFKLNSDGKLTTGNIMGFIGYKETSLAISSRFYPNGNDFFLHYMLSKVFGINVVNLNFSKGEESVHDFLPYLFPSYLQNALSQGLYKQYKRNQYNDANVKGAIDINRHIRINIPFAGKIAYTTREHSYDNSVTQLIRHTIEHLRTRDFGHSILTNKAETRANISQIEYATPTYKKNDLQRIIKANLKLVNHPYYTKYKDLQKLCLQILRREKTNF